jgi:hypothetical protein
MSLIYFKFTIWIVKLFPPRESLIIDIPAWDGNIKKLFLWCSGSSRLQCFIMPLLICSEVFSTVMSPIFCKFPKGWYVSHRALRGVRHSTTLSYPPIENSFNGCQGHPLVCLPPGTAQGQRNPEVKRLNVQQFIQLTLVDCCRWHKMRKAVEAWKQKISAYYVCRWLQLAQLAKGKKSRP